MGPILLVPLADLLAGQRPVGGGGNGGGNGGGISGGGEVRTALKTKKVGAPGVDVRIRVQYDAHLTTL